MTPKQQQNNQPSHLFIVRVWAEPLGNDHTELLRGQVHHVLSGETRYFRAWADLIAYINKQTDIGGKVAKWEKGGGLGRK